MGLHLRSPAIPGKLQDACIKIITGCDCAGHQYPWFYIHCFTKSYFTDTLLLQHNTYTYLPKLANLDKDLLPFQFLFRASVVQRYVNVEQLLSGLSWIHKVESGKMDVSGSYSDLSFDTSSDKILLTLHKLFKTVPSGIRR